MRLPLLALAFVTACTALPSTHPKQAASGPTTSPPVFGVPGEAMEFRVTLRGIVVGRLRVAVGELGWFEGKRSIIVRSRGDSDGVLTMVGKLAYELNTTLDLDRGHPIVHLEESWAEVAGKREHERDDDRWSEHDDHHDMHSAVGRFRGWRSQGGDRIALDVHVAGARLDVEAWHAGREYVAAAKAQAIRYEGLIAAEYPFRTWVSDDPSRVPLRFESASKWGSIVVEIVAYHAPAEP